LPATPEEAIAFLSSLPMSTFKFGLERITSALSALGNPERAFVSLHVAGTNGKGSTCAFAESILRAQGHRVGLYSSPHLITVNERFKVSGVDISDALLGQRILEVLKRVPEAASSPPPLTYFELGTAVAFWHFAAERVKAAVVETGLGGRLDATSALAPRAVAITPISYDHMEYLGDTLTSIAGEKAGIFKQGVPAAVSRQPAEAMDVIRRRAAELSVPLRIEGEDFALQETSPGRFAYRGWTREISELTLGLRGAHQVQNAAVAVAALELLALSGVAVTEAAIREGLASARWPGRLEELGGTPPVVVDGAHNEAGAAALVSALDALYPGRRVHLVFGVLQDKRVDGMARLLFPRCASVHLCPPDSPRALLPREYADLARGLNARVCVLESVSEALASARAVARPDDVVLCAGSLYLVGEVERLFL
jgi:dihydrofolate synthase/folylpolyglutamate synthase